MPIPLIEQWLSKGKYTCSICEFAKLYGIKIDYARELCKSAYPPPGFYSGNRYKILVSEMEQYMIDLSRKKGTIRV